MATDSKPMLLIRASRVHAAPGTDAAPAGAVLVRDGRVLAVGDGHQLEAMAGDARRLDLPNLTITPGLTDAHVHLVEWALSLLAVDLTITTSPEQAATRVAEHALAGGQGRTGDASGWVVGRGWDPHRWKAPPHRRHLDAALPGRPVLLHSHDMHSVWASSAALRLAGIDRDTPSPAGGRIVRDASGEPTGVLRDNAVPLLTAAAPAATERERRDALLAGQAALHRLGVTGVHTVEPDSLGLLEMARASDELRLRVLQHLPLAKLDEAIRLGLRSGFGGDWLRVGGIKMFLDGALGSRTAWMRAPYEGTDDDRGVSTLPPDEFRAAVRRGSAAGLAMTVHAIGDAANDLVLDVLHAEGGSLTGPVPHRIEHAQLIRRDHLGSAPHPTLRSAICSVQPSHSDDRLAGGRPSLGGPGARRVPLPLAGSGRRHAGAGIGCAGGAPRSPSRALRRSDPARSGGRAGRRVAPGRANPGRSGAGRLHRRRGPCSGRWPPGAARPGDVRRLRRLGR